MTYSCISLFLCSIMRLGCIESLSAIFVRLYFFFFSTAIANCLLIYFSISVDLPKLPWNMSSSLYYIALSYFSLFACGLFYALDFVAETKFSLFCYFKSMRFRFKLGSSEKYSIFYLSNF